MWGLIPSLGCEWTERLPIGRSGNAASSSHLPWCDDGTLSLLEPLSPRETRIYVAAHLARATPPDAVRARFDAETLSRLHARSQGVLARLNAEASSLLCAALR
jgi:hypothetical protein